MQRAGKQPTEVSNAYRLALQKSLPTPDLWKQSRPRVEVWGWGGTTTLPSTPDHLTMSGDIFISLLGCVYI